MNTTLNYTVTKKPKNKSIKVYYRVDNTFAGHIVYNPWEGTVKIIKSNEKLAGIKIICLIKSIERVA